jgi:hypothetical protein
LSSTGGNALILAGTNQVFWANGPGLYGASTSAAGGTATLVSALDGSINAISQTGGYIVSNGGDVVKLNPSIPNTTPIQTKFHMGDPIGGVAVDGVNLYFLDLVDSTVSGKTTLYLNSGLTMFIFSPAWSHTSMAGIGSGVSWATPTGTSGAVSISGVSGINQLFATSAYLYATAGSGVYRCSSSCSSPSPWASNQSGPAYVFSDGTTTYWTNSGNGTVMSCAASATTCTSPAVVAQGLSSPQGIAADSSAVYVATSSGVYRIAK